MFISQPDPNNPTPQSLDELMVRKINAKGYINRLKKEFESFRNASEIKQKDLLRYIYELIDHSPTYRDEKFFDRLIELYSKYDRKGANRFDRMYYSNGPQGMYAYKRR